MRSKRSLTLLLIALMLVSGWASAKQEIFYEIEVDLANQVVSVRHISDGTLARQMICSTGSGGEDATPTGNYRIKSHYPEERGEWYYIKQYECYVRYPTRIYGPYLFHSLPYAEPDLATIDQAARAQLGEPVSHGCIRLRSEDAQWIAENCPDGTRVEIFDDGVPEIVLHKQLLERSYIPEEWTSYAAYLAAKLDTGRTGAIEDMLHTE